MSDTRLDERFASNPLVTGALHIRFYASQPIRSVEGYAAGILCIIDTEPQTFDAAGIATLKTMAGMVEAELNMEQQVRAHTDAELAVRELNASP